MIICKNITEEMWGIHWNIMETFRLQGVLVRFELVGGIHKCVLADTGKVLFEHNNHEALHYMFEEWCKSMESHEQVGMWVAPF